jgi:hypothetical protein
MKNIIKLLLIVFSLLSLACGLDRANPLDPENGDVNIPSLVTNITLSASGQGTSSKFVIINWQVVEANDANGYYIYRSGSYDGTFELIAEIRNREQSSYTDYSKIVPGPYFYKMSAFLYLDPNDPNDSERLEGPLNRPGMSGIMVPE